MVSRGSKLAVIILSLGTGAGALSFTTGMIWPWIPVITLVSAAAIVVVGTFSGISLRAWVASVCVIAVGIRAGPYLLAPSSIGMDPDKYAVATLRIMESGYLNVVAPSHYSKLALFYLENTVSSLILGVSGRLVLITIPIILGLLLTLAAATITHRMAPTDRKVASGVAATIAAVSATGVFYGYWPIPQAIAVSIWCVLLISLERYLTSSRRTFFAIALISLTAAIFAHKTSLIIPTLAIIGAGIVYHTYPLLWDDRQNEFGYQRNWRTVGLLFGVILTIQWGYVTEFLYTFAIGIAIPFFEPGTLISATSTTYTAAEPHLTGLKGTIMGASSWIILLGMSGLAWTVVWWRQESLSRSQALVLGGVGVTGLFTASALLSSKVTPNRIQFYAIPLTAVLISLALIRVTRWTGVRRHHGHVAIVSLVILFIASQGTAAIIAPDYPETPRQYLTTAEGEGKVHVDEYISKQTPVATDFYYADEQYPIASDGALPNEVIPETAPGNYRLVNDGYLNGTIAEEGHPVILHRTSVEIWRFRQGWYRLEWPVEERLATDSDYHTVYANGEVKMYVATKD